MRVDMGSETASATSPSAKGASGNHRPPSSKGGTSTILTSPRKMPTAAITATITIGRARADPHLDDAGNQHRQGDEHAAQGRQPPDQLAGLDPPTGHGQVDEQAEEPGHEADGGTDQDEQVVGAHRVGASAGQRPEQPGQPTRLDAGEQVHDAITARMVTRA